MALRRRSFLAGAALAPGMAGAAERDLAARCIGAIRAALTKSGPGPVLLNSYEVRPQASDFDLTQANAAYVYDNALAGLALLASGHAEEAARIGKALAIAQAHDRFWRDGRLRNAYRAGPMRQPAELPGWWDAGAQAWREDAYQAGSQTGPVAWAMLLWAALGWQAPANRAGDWLNSALRAPLGYYGGFYGFEPRPLKLPWQSTEQNTDVFVGFTRLGRGEDAAHAAKFVRRMFSPRSQLFAAGTTPDGRENPLLAADAGIWPMLAGLGSPGSAAAAIAGLRHDDGIGFSTASQGIWPEGTAFAALALRRGQSPLAARFLARVRAALAPSGFVYAAPLGPLATGLDTGPALPGSPARPFAYYRRPALAPTAWAALAAMNADPLST